MIGRQVIEINKEMSEGELEKFMQEHWDKINFNDFIKAKPTPMSANEYICLPATPRFMVIVYPKKKFWIFSRKNKVVLSVCETPSGVQGRIFTALPTHNVFFGAAKIGATFSLEDERRGPAEEVLQKYAKQMKKILSDAGWIE